MLASSPATAVAEACVLCVEALQRAVRSGGHYFDDRCCCFSTGCEANRTATAVAITCHGGDKSFELHLSRGELLHRLLFCFVSHPVCDHRWEVRHCRNGNAGDEREELRRGSELSSLLMTTRGKLHAATAARDRGGLRRQFMTAKLLQRCCMAADGEITAAAVDEQTFYIQGELPSCVCCERTLACELQRLLRQRRKSSSYRQGGR